MSLSLARFVAVFDGVRIDRFKYRLDGGWEGLMFPQTDDAPPGVVQGRVRGAVAFDVAAEFGGPVPLIRCGLAAMFRAGVPKAAIDEDGNLPAGEDDVGTDAGTAGKVEPVIFAIPKPKCMQRTAEGDLRLGVRTAVSPHVAGTAIVGGCGVAGTGCCTVVGRI